MMCDDCDKRGAVRAGTAAGEEAQRGRGAAGERGRAREQAVGAGAGGGGEVETRERGRPRRGERGDASAPNSAPCRWTSTRAAPPPSAAARGVAPAAPSALSSRRSAQRRHGGRARRARTQVEVGQRADGERERRGAAAVRR
jgi:hypothetical protein